MTIPKLTPYTGQVANPDGSQTQTEFTQSMFGQLSYEAQLATELDATIDGMNQAVTDVENNAAAASASATAAEASASTAGYQGLWPDTGGSANKSDTYQTQVGGTPTGNYFTALQNTTVDPVGDNVNWKVAGTIGQQNLSNYTDIVYKASGGNSAVENMIAGFPVAAKVGDTFSTGSTSWKRVSDSNGDLSDFIPLNGVWVDDFGADPAGVEDSTLACQLALDIGRHVKFGEGVYLVDEIVSSNTKGASFSGAGSSVYVGTVNQSTTIKARTDNQQSIIKYNGGTRCNIKDLTLDGDGKALKNINCESPSLILDNVTSYRSKNYGIWAKALVRFKNVFVRDNQGIGCSISSDGAITDSEFTGGLTPLELRGGGNSLDGCWINTGLEKCLHINIETGSSVVNTRINNCYIGEVISDTVSKPSVHIQGTNIQRVRHVMFTGCHFVHAQTDTLSKNGLIRIEYGKGVTFSGCTFRGIGSFGSLSKHTDYGIYASDCSGLVVSGCYFESVNRNVIRVSGTTTFNINGNTFRECGEQFGTGQDRAMLRIDTTTISGVMIANSMQNPGSTEPYLAHGGDASLVHISDNLIRGGQPTMEWEGLVGYNQGRNLRAGQLGPTQRSVNMTPGPETSIQNNTLFVDSSDNLLKYRDSSGALKVVNFT